MNHRARLLVIDDREETLRRALGHATLSQLAEVARLCAVVVVFADETVALDGVDFPE